MDMGYLYQTLLAINYHFAELSILLATCWLYADMPDKAKGVLVSLRQRAPQTTIHMGGKEVELFEDEAQALAWFEKAIGLRPSVAVNHFNAATLAGLMCRNMISVGYDGRLFDCDFNQMLEMPIAHATSSAAVSPPLSIWEIDDLRELEGLPIATDSHCFGCTAGAGSSCGGALA